MQRHECRGARLAARLARHCAQEKRQETKTIFNRRWTLMIAVFGRNLLTFFPAPTGRLFHPSHFKLHTSIFPLLPRPLRVSIIRDSDPRSATYLFLTQDLSRVYSRSFVCWRAFINPFLCRCIYPVNRLFISNTDMQIRWFNLIPGHMLVIYKTSSILIS